MTDVITKKAAPVKVQPSDINAMMKNNDFVALHEWAEQGILDRIEIINTPLVRHLSSRSGTRMLVEALNCGMNPDTVNDQCKEPAIKEAVSFCRYEPIRALLWGGASTEWEAEQGGSLLHVAATASGQESVHVAERLVAEGVDLYALAPMEKTAEQKARGINQAIGRELRAYMKLDGMIKDSELTREKLFEPVYDDLSYNPLGDNWFPPMGERCATWAWAARIAEALEAHGEHLTHQDVTESPERLAWIVLGGDLDAVNAHLQQHGEPAITVRDFVTPEGNAAAVLESVAEEWSEKRLLGSQWMMDLPRNHFVELLNALPENAKERLGNLHQLSVQYDRNARREASQGAMR